MKTIKKFKKGSVLGVCVVLILVLVFVGLGLARLGTDSRVKAVKTKLEIIARSAADAGLTEARYAINTNAHGYYWSGGSPSPQTDVAVPGTNSTFSYMISGSGVFRDVNSTGTLHDTQRMVHAVLVIQSAFSEGSLLTKEECNLKNMVKVIGYNSSGNPIYDNVPVKIGSISNDFIEGEEPVIIGQNGDVDGSVVVGVGGDPDVLIKSGGTTNIEEKTALVEPIIFPDIVIPDYLVADTASTLVVDGNELLTSGKYTSIKLPNNGDTLEVTGDVEIYVTGDMDMANHTFIKVNTGSSLKIYIDGNITSGPECSFYNETFIPANFKIYGTSSTSQSFDLWPNTDFYGTIYAPNADIWIQPNGDWYGACLCNSFYGSNNNFNFYYDKALSSIEYGDPVYFAVHRWWED